MTGLTDLDVMSGGPLTSGYVVGTVTGSTRHRAVTLPKAGRFSQPVNGIDDFKLVVVAGSWRVIEMQDVVFKGFAWPVGKEAAMIPP